MLLGKGLNVPTWLLNPFIVGSLPPSAASLWPLICALSVLAAITWFIIFSDRCSFFPLFSLTGTHILVLTWVTLSCPLGLSWITIFLGIFPRPQWGSDLHVYLADQRTYHTACLVSYEFYVGRVESHVLGPLVHRVMSDTWWIFNKYLFNIKWERKMQPLIFFAFFSVFMRLVFFPPSKLLSECEFLQIPIIIS